MKKNIGTEVAVSVLVLVCAETLGNGLKWTVKKIKAKKSEKLQEIAVGA